MFRKAGQEKLKRHDKYVYRLFAEMELNQVEKHDKPVKEPLNAFDGDDLDPRISENSNWKNYSKAFVDMALLTSNANQLTFAIHTHTELGFDQIFPIVLICCSILAQVNIHAFNYNILRLYDYDYNF